MLRNYEYRAITKIDIFDKTMDNITIVMTSKAK